MTGAFWTRLGPRTIAGQVVLLVGLSVVLFHLAMTTALQLSLSEHDDARLRPEVHRFIGFVQALERLRPEDREPVAAAISQAYPSWQVRLLERTAWPEQNTTESAGVRELRRRLGPGLVVFNPGPYPPSENWVGVAFRDRGAITATLPLSGPNGPPAGRLVLGSIAFMAMNLAVLLWWATRGLAKPLARFAEAAESFSLEGDASPLPEGKGPNEVRIASRALNRLQARIRAMVEDRTRMVAAVGHDLRTPITRMRLRAEFIDDGETRAQMMRDLDQMAAMVHGALSYLRDGQNLRSKVKVDVVSVLRTVCYDFADMGTHVAYEGPNHLVAEIGAEEIARAVTNLVENAIKYASPPITVRLHTVSESEVEIDVIDNGPGIPEESKAAMLEPFARGDPARNLSERSAGFGLGLAIARQVALAHGGELVLENQKPAGLVARLRIPISPRTTLLLPPSTSDAGARRLSAAGAGGEDRALGSPSA